MATVNEQVKGLRNGLLYGVVSCTTLTGGMVLGLMGGPMLIVPALLLGLSGPLIYGLHRANQRDKDLTLEERLKVYETKKYPPAPPGYKKGFMIGTLAACTASALFNYAVLLPALTSKPSTPKTQTTTPAVQSVKTIGMGGVYRL